MLWTRRGAAAALVLTAAGALGPRAAAAGDKKDNIHTHILPDVLVKESRRFKGYSAFFSWSMALSADGRRLATGDRDNNVVVWDVSRGEPLRVMKGHTDTPFGLAFTPDGKTALSTGLDGTLRWWNVETGESLRAARADEGPVISVGLSSDGRVAATGSGSGVVKLWSVENGKLLRTLPRGFDKPIVAAQFTPDGKRLVTLTLSNTLTVWDLAAGKALRTADKPPHPVLGRFIAPDGKRLLFGGDALKLVDLESGRELREYPHSFYKDQPSIAVAFSPDGSLFAAEDGGYMLNVRETATGKLRARYALGDVTLGLSFTPDGKGLIALIGSDTNVGAVIAWPVDATPDPTKVRYVPYPASPDRPPASAAAAELGKLLLFDPRLSRDGTVSCTTCHDPHKGWADGRPVAVGIHGLRGRRNTMTLLNAAVHRALFWDGRADTLAEQAKFPLTDPREMDSSPELAAAHIGGVRGYKSRFKSVYGDEAVTGERIIDAIAEFERTLISRDSPYDRYVGGDAKALTEEQLRGRALFFGKALCSTCHRLDTNGGSFINGGLKPSPADRGRFEVTKEPKDLDAFTVPDLHNLRYTAPYFHDGSLPTLADVIEFYDRGGDANPGKALNLAPLGLTAREKKELLQFLDSLNGDPHVMDAPKLPE